MKLRICTFNIRNTTDRYDERKKHMSESIKEINADIIGFQEVAWSQIKRLKKSMQNNTTELKSPCETPILSNSKSDYRVDGDLLIFKNETDTGMKIKLIDHQFKFLSDERTVQKALLSVEKDELTKKFWVLNTHLHNGIKEKDYNIRLEQIESSYQWLIDSKDFTYNDSIIFMGDFNSIPDDKSYTFMINKGFKSSYCEHHGKEPEKTFPSGLIAPTMDKDDSGCIDFIWVTGDTSVLNSGLAANKPLENDTTIYPSDHFAVWADILL